MDERDLAQLRLWTFIHVGVAGSLVFFAVFLFVGIFNDGAWKASFSIAAFASIVFGFAALARLLPVPRGNAKADPWLRHMTRSNLGSVRVLGAYATLAAVILVVVVSLSYRGAQS
ncbi:MAG: hypothetical protein CMF74_11615 [Maricaulis sp.]|jgi:archaellum biogenesis protein FlaJ (TadC family)|nr:hypothetical protein [Maricaulis sp.]HAQ36838.1 hypothetical protein [Alphaproteobacteria bacterium]|tara:strand:+ start:522 stop:866 length:345 start_codon:yes stop_codon:yes gene_type:complete